MWLKLKTHLPTLDCVVTAAEYGHGKRRNSLSDYTFAVWDREPAEPARTLVNVGKAYSGVTDEEIAQLTELFTQASRSQQLRPRAPGRAEGRAGDRVRPDPEERRATPAATRCASRGSSGSAGTSARGRRPAGARDRGLREHRELRPAGAVEPAAARADAVRRPGRS